VRGPHRWPTWSTERARIAFFHRAGACLLAATIFSIRPITPKIEIYNPVSDSSFYVPPAQAIALARDNPHKWVSSKRLILGPDRNLKVTWEPKQSGEYGPLVLQVVT